jgi:hypothetical protein
MKYLPHWLKRLLIFIVKGANKKEKKINLMRLSLKMSPSRYALIAYGNIQNHCFLQCLHYFESLWMVHPELALLSSEPGGVIGGNAFKLVERFPESFSNDIFYSMQSHCMLYEAFADSAGSFYLTDVYASEVSRLGEVNVADPLPVMSLHCKEGRRPAVFLRFRSVWIVRDGLARFHWLVKGICHFVSMSPTFLWMCV